MQFAPGFPFTPSDKPILGRLEQHPTRRSQENVNKAFNNTAVSFFERLPRVFDSVWTRPSAWRPDLEPPRPGSSPSFSTLGWSHNPLVDRPLQAAIYGLHRMRLPQVAMSPPETLGVSSGQTLERSLVVDGTTRDYRVYVPESVDPSSPAPVLFALHGTHGSADQIQAESGLNQAADRYGIIVVYPNALNKQWNDGRPDTFSKSAGVDDVEFIHTIAEQVQSEFNIDTSRLGVTGISNGGKMAMRAALELPELFTSMMPVVANIPQNQLSQLALDTADSMNVLMINGTQDPAAPWVGSDNQYNFLGRAGATFSVPKGLNFWLNYNGGSIRERPDVVRLAENDPRTESTLINYQTREGSTVSQIIVNGGGHNLPGAKPYAPGLALLAGRTATWSGADLIARFLINNPEKPTDVPSR